MRYCKVNNLLILKTNVYDLVQLPETTPLGLNFREVSKKKLLLH